MNVALQDSALPARLRLDRPMTDEELFQFCAENETLRVERDANGELILMSPTGLEGSGWNSDVNTDLTNWARRSGLGRERGLNERHLTNVDQALRKHLARVSSHHPGQAVTMTYGD